jgi:hypothetical protein
MVLPNPKQTYKANLLDYDVLLALSDNECSYCLSEREVAMLLPFMDYISWRTRYIATETNIDQETINKWSANLARKLMSGCCGDEGLHRFNEDGVYQSSLDGGETWFDDSENDPRNNATYFPPLAGEDGAEKRCEGAANAQEFLKQNLIDELASGLAYAEIYSTIIGIIAILGITGIGVIIGVVTAAIFVAGVIVVQAAFTSEVWEDLKCILYCHIDDDASYNETQWGDVKNDILSQFTGVVQIILWNWVNALGFVGLTNSARSNMALGADCSDCACENCSNLNNWVLVYGTILEQSPGYLRIASTDAGSGNQSVRVRNLTSGEMPECCAVTYDIITGVATNQAYYPCGSPDPVFSVPPPETCMYDINITNVFSAAMEIEFFFTECP